jgi:crossover junction endodeoxyribonuclease RuvC
MAKKSSRTQWAAQIKNGTLGKSKEAPIAGYFNRKAFKGIILGIDPSLRGTGLAVIRFIGKEKGELLHTETVSPPKEADLPNCLGCIAEAVERLIQKYPPTAVAIEETIYVQNFRTAQKLGAAFGAAIGQAAKRGFPVFEYPPLRIKQAVVGYGRASKEQVTKQVKALLGLENELPFDEADASATAICHAWTGGPSE